MPVPFDGTTTLPRDAGNRYHWGWWDGTAYRAPKGTASGHGGIVPYDTAGTALLTSANPGYVQVGDGKDVVHGTTTDAAVVTDVAGTTAGKLRGLIKILADIWVDAANSIGVHIRNTAGTEIGTNANPIQIGDAGGSITIDGPVSITGTPTVITNGAGIHVAADIIANANLSANTQLKAATPNLRLIGVAAKESAGTAAKAKFILRHGTLEGDAMVAPYNLLPEESVRDDWEEGGIKVPNGVFLDWISGTVDITLFTKEVA